MKRLQIASLRSMINPVEYQPLWKDYLERSGNACHIGDVPNAAIKRYAVMDVDKMPNVKTALDNGLARCKSREELEHILDPLVPAIFDARDYERLDLLFDDPESASAREFCEQIRLGCTATDIHG